LRAVGQKSISTLVDITNYMTLGLNRPLHVYDADKLKGNIHARFSKKGESFEALDDNTYTLNDGMSVICDDSGVLGLGGIIGGTSTAVDENTTNVYLECAYFEPNVIAKAGQKLQIDSDARYRFERGIDPEFSAQGAEIATQLIIDLCGGNASENFIAGNIPDITKTIQYSPERVKALGGYEVDSARQKEILTALGFTIKDAGNSWEVKSPSWRHDIGQGTEDIVEEILRINGYENIPSLPVVRDVEQEYPKLSSLQKYVRNSRHTLATRGMFETVTWSFMEEKKSELFGMSENPNKAALTICKPLSSEWTIMRPSMLPNLIEAAGRNSDRGYPDVALFETGGIYISPENDGQLTVATGIRSGNIDKRHWAKTERKTDAIDAKGDVVAALQSCGVNTDNLQVVAEAPNWYHPGRSGALKMGKNVIAYFGEIHPTVLTKLNRDENYVGFEIFLDKIPQARNKGTNKGLLKTSSLQPISRDFAFIVEQNVAADKFIRTIKVIDKNLISNVEIFDVYMGKGVEEGKKSIALAVTLQPKDKTLTDDEYQRYQIKLLRVLKNRWAENLEVKFNLKNL